MTGNIYYESKSTFININAFENSMNYMIDLRLSYAQLKAEKSTTAEWMPDRADTPQADAGGRGVAAIAGTNAGCSTTADSPKHFT